VKAAVLKRTASDPFLISAWKHFHADALGAETSDRGELAMDGHRVGRRCAPLR